MTSEMRHRDTPNFVHIACHPGLLIQQIQVLTLVPFRKMVQKCGTASDGFTSRWRAVVCGGAVVAMAVMYNLYAETAAENAELRRTLAKVGLMGVRDAKQTLVRR